MFTRHFNDDQLQRQQNFLLQYRSIIHSYFFFITQVDYFFEAKENCFYGLFTLIPCLPFCGLCYIWSLTEKADAFSLMQKKYEVFTAVLKRKKNLILCSRNT